VNRAGLIDLASERLGGKALVANDEFFAPKENLLKPGRGVFLEDKYTDRGKWMDGWETRRRRGPGHDWCIIRLGVCGTIRSVTVDTNHFRGNHPVECSLDAAVLTATASAKHLVAFEGWREIVPRSPLLGHCENEFEAASGDPVTHVRLNIYPDGGVARLRVWGEAQPDWTALRDRRKPVDLVAAAHGGVPLASSDEFFGQPINLLMPGTPANMGDGWETRRRRGPGHDWVVLRLGHRGVVEAADVDTSHFKGNYPESCSLEALDAPELAARAIPSETAAWQQLLPRTKLGPDAVHRFAELVERAPITHVRFNIYPDGGVARLRLWGRATSE
jgi:allantoicase